MGYSEVVLADGPIGYYRLASGSLTTDSSGFARTLTQAGTNFVNKPSLIGSDQTNGATAFDTNTSLGELSSTDSAFKFTGRAAFSVEAWFKPNTLDGSFRRIIGMSDDGSGTQNGYSIQYHNTTGIGCVRYAAGVIKGRFFVPAQYTVNDTFHVVLTYDGDFVRTYVNGVFRDQEQDTASAGAYVGNFVISVGQFGSTCAIADIDEVAFYAKELTAVRIAAHYDAARATSAFFSRPLGVGPIANMRMVGQARFGRLTVTGAPKVFNPPGPWVRPRIVIAGGRATPPRVLARTQATNRPRTAYTPPAPRRVLVQRRSTTIARRAATVVVKAPFVQAVAATAKTILSITVHASRRALVVRALTKPRSRKESPNQPFGRTTGRQPVVRGARRPAVARGALSRWIIIGRPPRTGLPASAYTRTKSTILVYAQAVNVKLNPRASTRTHQAREVRPPRTGLPASAYTRTTRAILVKAGAGRSRMVRALDRREQIGRAPKPYGMVRKLARVVYVPQRAPARARSLIRALVVTRPPRSGLPASAYTRTVSTILVHMAARRPGWLKTRQAERATLVQPPKPFGKTTGRPPTVKVSRRPMVARGMLRSLQVLRPPLRGVSAAAQTNRVRPAVLKIVRRRPRPGSVVFAKPRQPLGTTRSAKPVRVARARPSGVWAARRVTLLSLPKRGGTTRRTRSVRVVPTRRPRARAHVRIVKPAFRRPLATVGRTTILVATTTRGLSRRASIRSLQIVRSLNGTVGALVNIVTGFFDMPRPAGPESTTTTDATVYRASTGADDFDDDGPAGSTYDRPGPGRSL